MVLNATRRVSNNKETPRPQRKRNGGSHKASIPTSEGSHAANPPPTVNPGANDLSLSTEDDLASLESVSSDDAPRQQQFKLPKQLQRPKFRPISPESISVIEPSLANVPIEYVRQKLSDAGERLFAITTKITAHCPTGKLPQEIEITIDEPSPDVPTHIFGIFSPPSASKKHSVVLYPVHGIVLAAYCANLPALPRSHPSGHATKVTLPILPLALPSPRTFPVLLRYIYTRQDQGVLSALFPVSVGNLSPDDQIKKIAETCTVSAILASIYTVHGLWNDIVALGIFDDTLWRVIEHAWTTLSEALSMKTGETCQTQ